ncbi:sigma-E factor negative regulatory protein [Microbulbifer spongiae]|uniref:Sigma-E factor negative regulatory protein n=1 Tax=Microbulbifer spongiae TaxID=2944933 RepID=A0ABY9EGR2_9GAMM|nr:sigma-E factor negative regulatory protein [Microbulbifer sp. MI-G]WKD50899.1 sigma-E factor negative regulatory protein [Microbulbifer sp. MI-G]
MSHGNHQERLNESLSALMDGEVDELELQRILRATAASGDLSACWSRYQLAASVIRREQVASVDSDLSASISSAIALEAPLSQTTGDGRITATLGLANHRWWRSLSHGAVAATVAFAAILGVQQITGIQQNTVEAVPQLAKTERPAQPVVQSAPQPSGFYVPAPSTRSVSTAVPRFVPEQRSGAVGQAVIQQAPTPELMRHLNRVMIQHSEQAAHIGSQGMVPFARATYGEQVGM